MARSTKVDHGTAEDVDFVRAVLMAREPSPDERLRSRMIIRVRHRGTLGQ